MANLATPEQFADILTPVLTQVYHKPDYYELFSGKTTTGIKRKFGFNFSHRKIAKVVDNVARQLLENLTGYGVVISSRLEQPDFRIDYYARTNVLANIRSSYSLIYPESGICYCTPNDKHPAYIGARLFLRGDVSKDEIEGLNEILKAGFGEEGFFRSEVPGLCARV